MSRFFINRPIVAIVIAIVTVLGRPGRDAGAADRAVPRHHPAADHRHGALTRGRRRTIEQAVATPLEQQMNGVDNMLYMQSTNANDGTMQLTVTFDVDTDVEHRSGQRPEPPGAGPAQPAARCQHVRPDAAQDRPAFRCWSSRLSSPNKTYDDLFLANYANINIIDSLFRVPGVGDIRIFGGQRLRDAHLGQAGPCSPNSASPCPSWCARCSSRAPSIRPVRSARSRRRPAQEMTYTVRAQGGCRRRKSSDAIVVRANPDGSMVRLQDVARIELGALNYQQIGRVNGQPGCAIGIFQTPGSNALDVADGVKQMMADLAQRFPADVQVRLSDRHDARRDGGHPRNPDHARRSDGSS